MYGKQTERAIGALSRLAEVWDGGATRLSAMQIAEQRGLPAPMVAKILSTLSQAGIVAGSPGPGGGYSLARPPAEITLKQVHALFERENHSQICPFSGGHIDMTFSYVPAPGAMALLVAAAGGPQPGSPTVCDYSARMAHQTGRGPTTASDTALNRPLPNAKLLQRIFAGGAALLVRSKS